jgi:heme/copper-type cytochrome/quinol oxidase subunit 4
MENLALLAFIFVVSILVIVFAATYWLDTIADRNDQSGG